MVKYVLTLGLASVFCFNSSNAQRFSLGLFGGAANYAGDMTSAPYQSKTTHGAFAGTLSYELTDNFSLRGQLSVATVSGADRFSNKEDLRARNLSFASKIYEASLLLQYDLLSMYDHRFTPYAFVGLAAYRFNPYTIDRNGETIFLARLGTEGQGLTAYPDKQLYSINQINIPIGGGIKYRLTEKLQIGLEVGLRKLFTDYLDDVSGTYADRADLELIRGTRVVELAYRGDELPGGDPYPAKGSTRGGEKYKDYYYLSGLHLNYRLDFRKGSGFLRSKDPNRCPTNVY